MTTPPNDWHGVAVGRLVKVFGAQSGHDLVRSIAHELGIDRIHSAQELRVFAAALARRGGFAAAVAGLLDLHATMHGDVGPQVGRSPAEGGGDDSDP